MDYKKKTHVSPTSVKDKTISEKNPRTDSSISMTFDSDVGYKSADIPSSSSVEYRRMQSSSKTISKILKKDSSFFDSGLEFEVFSPLTSERDITYSGDSGISEESKKQNIEQRAIHIWQDVYNQDQDGDTILHLAIVEARSDVIFPLIQQAPHPDFLDICNDLCQTPLHLAVLTGKSNIVRRLVAAGATLDLQDRNGNTALHISSRNGDLDCVQAILQQLLPEEIEAAQCPYNVFPQSHDLSNLINTKNHDGQTSLHLAAIGGFKKVLECLSDLGADVNDQEGKGGKTALHLAVDSGNFEVVQILVTKCHANVTAKNYAYQTPVFVAWSLCKKNKQKSHIAIFEFLKKHSNERWESPLESESSLSDESETDIQAAGLH